MAQKAQPLIDFLLRTIRIGINATWLVVAGLAFFLIFSPDEGIDRPRFLAVLLVALVGAVIVALLPWSRLLRSRWGWPALYAWSVLDIVLITILIDASGDERSVVFVIYGLTTVFFSASYPRAAQWFLLIFTFAFYITVGLVSGWQLEIGWFVLRVSVLTSLMYIVSYLSSALIEQNAELERRAERQRRTSQQLLDVQKLARLGSWTYEPESGQFGWSDELREIYGAPPDEEGIAFFMQSVHAEDRHDLEKALAGATRNRSSFALEHRIMRADGSIRYLQAQGKFEDRVSPPTVLGTALDITERKKANEYDAKLRDLEANRSQALQINDNIVQGITVAKYALEMGRLDVAAEALESTLAGAKDIVRELLSDGAGIEPAAVLRTEPAVLHRRTSANDAGDDAPSASLA